MSAPSGIENLFFISCDREDAQSASFLILPISCVQTAEKSQVVDFKGEIGYNKKVKMDKYGR